LSSQFESHRSDNLSRTHGSIAGISRYSNIGVIGSKLPDIPYHEAIKHIEKIQTLHSPREKL
jgi:hypothetical protein